MGVKAYVLIEVTVGRIREAAEALRQLDHVKTVDAVTGPFDIVALVEGQDLTQIGELIATKVHAVPGVHRTMTCVVV